MVRTRDQVTNVRVSGAKAPRSKVATPKHTFSSIQFPSTSKNTGGNPYCPRETPAWQKPITNFFSSAADDEAGPSKDTCDNINTPVEAACSFIEAGPSGLQEMESESVKMAAGSCDVLEPVENGVAPVEAACSSIEAGPSGLQKLESENAKSVAGSSNELEQTEAKT